MNITNGSVTRSVKVADYETRTVALSFTIDPGEDAEACVAKVRDMAERQARGAVAVPPTSLGAVAARVSAPPATSAATAPAAPASSPTPQSANGGASSPTSAPTSSAPTAPLSTTTTSEGPTAPSGGAAPVAAIGNGVATDAEIGAAIQANLQKDVSLANKMKAEIWKVTGAVGKSFTTLEADHPGRQTILAAIKALGQIEKAAVAGLSY
ncbi:MAG: hypothetical protein ACREDH_15655 [Methylocella sp.]